MPTVSPELRLKGLGQQKLNALTAKAKRLGMTPERYVRQLVEEDLAMDVEAREKSFAELMAPVREDFRKSGMSEAELDEIVDRARTRHHERNSRKRK